MPAAVALCVRLTHLVLLVLLVGIAPPFVQGCSCARTSPSRSDAIKQSYCASYRPDVYSGTVIAATCNCIPGHEASPTLVESSSFLNCHHFQLDASQRIVNTTTLSRGQCALNNVYATEFSVCVIVGNTLLTWGLSVEGPVQSASGDDQLPLNLTDRIHRCNLACPFNNRSRNYRQPCMYTLRVTKVFKGNYSRDEEIVVAGPDVMTSCGSPGLRLQISSTYVVGIGGACSPISDWTHETMYSVGELELLRNLRDGEVTCAAADASLPSIAIPILTVVLASILPS